jgi:2-polyprenyl-3-methyl-5-hydroxy-6-metoxy-1,4-benzoquinol methylase
MNDIKVKNHFHKTAQEFDDIYDDKGGILDRIATRVFRKAMFDRVNLAVQGCGDVSQRTILDIGCGSGRVSLALAEKGARVIGIDYAQNMIDLANKYTDESKLKGKVEFYCSDFMTDFKCNEPFDITIALGVFDYIKDPGPFLDKMREVTREKMIISYPYRFNLKMPLRKLWLLSRGCPVYFYTESKLSEMYERSGITQYDIVKLPLNSRMCSVYYVESKP